MVHIEPLLPLTLASDARIIRGNVRSHEIGSDIANDLQDLADVVTEFRQLIAVVDYPPHLLSEISGKCAALMELLCETVIDGPVERCDRHPERHLQHERV